MELQRVVLVLAQVSGLEHLPALTDPERGHAEQHVSDLMGTLADTIQPPLRLYKLEGDGLFLYAPITGAESVLAYTVACQFPQLARAFDDKLQSLIVNRACRCAACLNLHLLRLTVISHLGEVVVKQIKQFKELAGENVILVHRLLRQAPALAGSLIMTDVFYRQAAGWTTASPRLETVEAAGLGEVLVRVYDQVAA